MKIFLHLIIWVHNYTKTTSNTTFWLYFCCLAKKNSFCMCCYLINPIYRKLILSTYEPLLWLVYRTIFIKQVFDSNEPPNIEISTIAKPLPERTDIPKLAHLKLSAKIIGFSGKTQTFRCKRAPTAYKLPARVNQTAENCVVLQPCSHTDLPPTYYFASPQPPL